MYILILVQLKAVKELLTCVLEEVHSTFVVWPKPEAPQLKKQTQRNLISLILNNFHDKLLTQTQGISCS